MLTQLLLLFGLLFIASPTHTLDIEPALSPTTLQQVEHLEATIDILESEISAHAQKALWRGASGSLWALFAIWLATRGIQHTIEQERYGWAFIYIFLIEIPAISAALRNLGSSADSMYQAGLKIHRRAQLLQELVALKSIAAS